MKNIPLYEVRTICDLKDMLAQSVKLYGDKAAFLAKSSADNLYHPITFRQFGEDVNAMGTALIHLGLKGKRIAIIGENRYEWSISYLATVNGTGIVVPLDKELPENEIENLLIRSHANAIFYTGKNHEEMEKLAARLDFVEYCINMDGSESNGKMLSFHKLLEQGHKLLQDGMRDFLDAEIQAEEMSILLFTSGTTDMSKAVMLSHKNIAANLMAMCSMLYIDDKDIFLSVLPIHHTYECTCGFLCQIYRGSTVAYFEGLRHIPKNLQESKTTMMLGVPLIFEAMYKRIWDQAAKKPGTVKKLKTAIKISNFLLKFGIDLRRKLFAQIHESLGGHVRLFISGAAGIDPEVAKGFREFGISLVQGYGLTECAPIAALNRDIDYKDDAAGLPLPGLQVKIDAPDAEDVGEIIVKGPSVMLGYYESPEYTAKVLRDGWFYTGDLGFMDKDGFVHITGRKKNVIVTKNGKNIYPEEIEVLLGRSFYVLESMVYGKEDPSSGDIMVAAAIVPNQEKIDADASTGVLPSNNAEDVLHEVVKKINKELVGYKHIKHFHIRTEEFQKTTTKKIKRYLEHEQ